MLPKKAANLPAHITLIAAVSRDNAIGIDNQLPWHLPSDLAFFKAQTLGKPIIMGRKTWESIGRALPGRRNIVISRQLPSALHLPTNVERFDSLTSVLSELATLDEVMIIGGGQLFAAALPLADKIILNRIDTDISNADAFFPKLEENAWICKSREVIEADEQNVFSQSREFWIRKD